jgi:sensor histidine kinase YesM
MIGVAYALDFYSRSRQRELTEAQLQASLAEARLRSVRSQLNPHFLFNTLNAISALALRGEKKSVARALARLTNLLRITLNERYPQIISLAIELQLIDNYLEIQKLLFGDRLAIERKIHPDALNAMVPCMILQPLVENAIVHGISRCPGIGHITIEASRSFEVVYLRIVDSGPGFSPEAAVRTGIGLGNTKSRLEYHYGTAQSIEFGRSGEGGGCVTISMPFHTDALDAEILSESIP